MKKINRVKKYREFHEIFDKRVCKRSNLFTIYYRKNDYGFERYGLLVTKKNGIAVTRNKIKRQVRMMIDKVSDYSKPLDIIFVVSKRYDINHYTENEHALPPLLSRIRSKNKKILGAIAVAFTLGLLTACNSFCSDQDTSSYRYGYDSVNTSFFDEQDDALTYANSFVTDGYEKITTKSDFAVSYNETGEKEFFISSETLYGNDTGIYYIHPCTIKVPSTKLNDKNEPESYLTLTFSKNSYIQTLETTATSSYINLPHSGFYEDIDKKTIDLAYEKAVAAKDSYYSAINKEDLNLKDIYGYTFKQLMGYKEDKAAGNDTTD